MSKLANALVGPVAGFIIGGKKGALQGLGNLAAALAGPAAFLLHTAAALTSPSSTSAKGDDRAASAATLSIGEVPREAWFGQALNGGSLADAFNYGGANGTDWEVQVVALADHQCEALVGFYVNDQYVAFAGDGPVAGYNDQLVVYWRSGTETQSVPAILTANGPGWTANDNGAGVCYVVVAYKADAADAKNPVWPNGRPTFQWLLKGKKLYQARLDSSVGGSGAHRWSDPSTWAWSDNPIDCHYNFARGVYACDRITDPGSLLVGRGLSTVEAPPANVFAPAAVCDEAVSLDAGGTEKRYRTNGVVRASDTFLDVAEQFAAACGGVIHQPEGAVEIEPGQAKSPVFYFSDDDLVVGSSVRFSDDLDDSSTEWVNTVVPRYVEPTQRFAEFAAPVRRVSADLTTDGGPREQTLTLQLVTSGTQAGRVGEIARRLGRLWQRGTVTLGPRFAEIEEGDWGVWTSQRYLGGASAVVRVDAFGSDEKWHNTLTLRQIATSVYAKDADASSAAVALQQASPSIVAPGAGAWSLAAGALAGSGDSVPALVITGAADNSFAELVRFEYLPSAGVVDPATASGWREDGTAGPDVKRREIAAAPNTGYFVAVSYIVGRVPGPRRILGPVTTGAVTTAQGTASATKLAGIDSGATSSDNILPNAALNDGTVGWNLNAGSTGLSRVVATAADPANYFHGTANNNSVGSLTVDVPAGAQTLYASYWKRSSEGAQQIAFDVQFLDPVGNNAGFVRTNRFQGATTGWYFDSFPVAVPNGAVRLYVAPVLVMNAGHTHDIGLIRLATTEAAATRGATWGVNIGGSNLPDDNATRNRVTYSTTAPASPVNGDIWVDLNGAYAVFKLRNAGVWQTGATALAAYNDLSGKPIALADINTTESAKLSSIDTGATRGDNMVPDPLFTLGAAKFTLSGTGISFVSGTAAGNPGNGYVNIPYNASALFYVNTGNPIPITFGVDRRVHFSATVFHSDRVAGYGLAYLDCFNAAGSNIGQAAAPLIPLVHDAWTQVGAWLTAPAGTVAIVASYDRRTVNSGGDSASVGVTAIRVATTEASADVTPVRVTGPTAASIAFDYAGTAKAGALPVDINFKGATAAGTDVTTSAAWSATLKSGTATFTIGAATGILNVTALSADAVVEVAAAYGGKTGKATVAVQRVLDPPPVTTGSSGGSGSAGGSASTSTISQTTSTSYGSANTGVLTVKAGSAGAIALTFPGSFKRTTIGTSGAYGKWQKSAAGAGSWSDVATEIGSTVSADKAGGAEPYSNAGSIAVSQTASGLTSGSDYDFRLLLRNDDAVTCNWTGTASAVAQ